MYVLDDYFLLKTDWIYFKYNGLLHRLNVYKIPRKEHQVVDFWVSEILVWKWLECVPLI